MQNKNKERRVFYKIFRKIIKYNSENVLQSMNKNSFKPIFTFDFILFIERYINKNDAT